MWFKKLVEYRPQMIEIGPTTMVDVNAISAVYKRQGGLTIRIGGMGVMDIQPNELFESIEDTYDKIAKVLLP